MNIKKYYTAINVTFLKIMNKVKFYEVIVMENTTQKYIYISRLLEIGLIGTNVRKDYKKRI